MIEFMESGRYYPLKFTLDPVENGNGKRLAAYLEVRDGDILLSAKPLKNGSWTYRILRKRRDAKD